MNEQAPPPEAPRTDALGRLRRELWHACNTGERQLAARIQHQIDTLTAAQPERETAAADNPARETTSRPTPRRPRVPRQ